MAARISWGRRTALRRIVAITSGDDLAFPLGVPRSIWKGSIAFGLVNIPVDLVGAEDRQDLAFTQLDRRDFAPIGYQRINKATGKEVEWKDIVKGYEHAKDEYVVLTPEEIEAANPKATHTIDLVAFVPVSEIDPIYFEKPYYLVPTKASARPYALLREALKRSERVGVARIVIRTRQHVAAIAVEDRALVLIVLRYAHELRGLPSEGLPSASLKSAGVTEREIALADKIIETMADDWKPEKYKDEFFGEVMGLIERKVAKGEVNTLPSHVKKAPSRTKAATADLATLLEQSLSEKPKPASRRRRAPTGRRQHVARKSARAPRRGRASHP